MYHPGEVKDSIRLTIRNPEISTCSNELLSWEKDLFFVIRISQYKKNISRKNELLMRSEGEILESSISSYRINRSQSYSCMGDIK